MEKNLVVPRDQPFRLEITTPGILDELRLQPTTRRAPGPGEVEIRVQAMGLSFRELMKALGIYPDLPDGPITFSGECAGRIVALGREVEGFQIDDEVIAISPSCFGAFITAPTYLVVPKLVRLSFEEAVTIPTAFLTAHYALRHVGRLQQGERILIHAAAGGVGLAAVQLAQQAGAEIFATAGGPEKREFLRTLGIQHIMDSRSLAFADEVRELTDGDGVDIVLNSLAGEFIPKSLASLGTLGRFLEIGKRDIYENRQLSLGPFRNCVSFHAIDLEKVWKKCPDFFARLFREVMQDFENETLRPLPYQAFPIAEVVSAFRYMRKAKHIGKIVVVL